MGDGGSISKYKRLCSQVLPTLVTSSNIQISWHLTIIYLLFPHPKVVLKIMDVKGFNMILMLKIRLLSNESAAEK